jgi:hypothetical protein
MRARVYLFSVNILSPQNGGFTRARMRKGGYMICDQVRILYLLFLYDIFTHEMHGKLSAWKSFQCIKIWGNNAMRMGSPG